MFYLVEQKVAEVMNQSPVSVIGRENLKLHSKFVITICLIKVARSS